MVVAEEERKRLSMAGWEGGSGPSSEYVLLVKERQLWFTIDREGGQAPHAVAEPRRFAASMADFENVDERSVFFEDVWMWVHDEDMCGSDIGQTETGMERAKSPSSLTVKDLKIEVESAINSEMMEIVTGLMYPNIARESVEWKEKLEKNRSIHRQMLHYIILEQDAPGPVPYNGWDEGREGKTSLSHFCNDPRAQKAGLIQAEVAALRLYTTNIQELFNVDVRACRKRCKRKGPGLPRMRHLIKTAVDKLINTPIAASELRSVPNNVFRSRKWECCFCAHTNGSADLSVHVCLFACDQGHVEKRFRPGGDSPAPHRASLHP